MALFSSRALFQFKEMFETNVLFYLQGALKKGWKCSETLDTCLLSRLYLRLICGMLKVIVTCLGALIQGHRYVHILCGFCLEQTTALLYTDIPSFFWFKDIGTCIRIPWGCIEGCTDFSVGCARTNARTRSFKHYVHIPPSSNPVLTPLFSK